MSAKFIFLFFTTYLLVQSSFGTTPPEDLVSSKKDTSLTVSGCFDKADPKNIIDTRKKTIDTIAETLKSLGPNDLKYGKFLFNEYVNLMRFSDKSPKNKIEEEELVLNFVNTFKQNAEEYYSSLTIEEQAEKKPFADFLQEIRNKNETKEQFGLILDIFDLKLKSDNEVEDDAIWYAIYSIEKVLEAGDFWIREFLNFLHLKLKEIKGEVDQKEGRDRFVHEFIQNADAYYNSLTIKEQRNKCPFKGFLEELRNNYQYYVGFNVIVEALRTIRAETFYHIMENRICSLRINCPIVVSSHTK